MKTDAECERSIQAQKLIDLFEDVHGRPAISARELVDWAASPEGQAAIAADHREEIFSRAGGGFSEGAARLDFSAKRPGKLLRLLRA